MPLVHVRLSQNHMATTFDFVVSCDTTRALVAEQVLQESHALVRQLEDELTEFREVSPVYRLNHAPPGEPVPFPPSTWELLERSERLEAQTQGAFSATFRSQGSAPGPRLGKDPALRTVWRLDPGAHLGFGAVGKGYALDRVRTLVEREGFQDYVLSAGGSSQILSGFASAEEPWSWGWSWKRNEQGEPLGLEFVHTTGEPIALGVSGFHEKGNHIRGNRTDWEPPCVSAFVGHGRATEADAYSTALLVGGWESRECLQHEDPPAALAVIDRDEVPHWNGRFEWFWGSPAGLIVLWLVTFLGTGAQAEEGEEALDLTSLGFDDFTPYLYERDPVWILLPALSLVLVFLHLIKPRRPKVGPGRWEAKS